MRGTAYIYMRGKKTLFNFLVLDAIVVEELVFFSHFTSNLLTN